MISQHRHVGERLSLKAQLCTVRYVGSVAEKAGSWIGVEWDDPNRGKHNGTHDGRTYFECRSKSPSAASFLRPAQPWDEPRTFLEAVRAKYMPEFHEGDAEIVYFSGKQAEEIGFEKFSKRQVKLQGIHVLVLDHSRIQHRPQDNQDESDLASISEVCAEISELDLSGNLFESLDEIIELCRLLPKLRVLTLSGNRFTVKNGDGVRSLPRIRSLDLSRTLLHQAELNDIFRRFPSLDTLVLADNEVDHSISLDLPSTLKTLDLSANFFTSLSQLRNLHCPSLRELVLKRNLISAVQIKEDSTLAVVELDLSYNALNNWSFFNSITAATLPNLKHLRVTGNPLYKNLISAEGKPLAAEDGYMLTIARLPQLEYLNYAKITDKERLNGETYYLRQIAVELSNAPEDREAEVLARHPRYKALCDEYGEPTIERESKQNEIDPNTLAAKLVTITLFLPAKILPHINQRSWVEEVPKSFNIYYLFGLVGKRLGCMPLDLQLILETSEQDPVGRDSGYAGPEWWDSSDEEDETGAEGKWVKREVELVAGTRAIGTYVEGREATVRIEKKRRLD